VQDRLLGAVDKVADPDRYRAGMALIAANPEGEFRREFTLKDSGRSFFCYVAPVRDSGGGLGGRLLLLREITAEREAERLKDELVATVSHELRTPLTSIIGYLELVLKESDQDLSDEQRHFLEIVDRNARRLLAVVGDLLFVAQVEAGRLTLEREPLDPAQLVAETVEAARPLAEAKEIELIPRTESGLGVSGDRLRLNQLLANLVSNAIKFTPAGGEVEARVHERDGQAVLEVSDTGIGIPHEEQERLFERFFRSSSATSRAIQGTGLGLVICKAIAEAHGGSISFTSAEGKGTTFSVALPLVAAPLEARA
jgi:signal transduction histidine kinase